MSSPLQFVDKTPERSTPFDPTTGQPPADASSTAAGTSPDQPLSFFGKIAYGYHAVQNFRSERLRTLRPWREFADRSKFSWPGKIEAFSRANKNLAYFYSNYCVVAFLISTYVLITNSLFMFSMILCASMYYYVKGKAASSQPITFRGREYSPAQLYTLLVIFTLFSFYFTDGSSTVFWLVSLTGVAVLGHAVARQPEDDLHPISVV